MTVGGEQTSRGAVFPVATRTRRRGLLVGGTAHASGATSILSTVTAIQWDQSAFSNEVPLQARFRTTGHGNRLSGELGAEGSSVTARLLSGGGSLVYTSTNSATWTDWENVSTNFRSKSDDDAESNVLCYLWASGSATPNLQYEVQTVPRQKLAT